jgi:nicotinate-nucleotide adenylyltransferase
MSRRIGLLGGTFNPVHRGHIDVGLRVQRDFALDQVLFVLSARPPHKGRQRLPEPDLRLSMLEAALAPHAPHLVACDIELKRDQPSWTIDTLRQLHQERPGDTFFFIAGSEGFLKIRTWKEYRQVLTSVFFIIALRRRAHRRAVTALLESEGIPALEGSVENATVPAAFLYAYDSPWLELSSTAVRRRSRAGGDVSALVEPEVKSIMAERRIYESR